MPQFQKNPLLWVLSLLPTLLSAQFLTFTPEKPAAGETISVSYDQSASPFKGDSKLRIAVFALDADKLTGLAMETMEKNGVLHGEVIVPAGTKAIYFVPRSMESDTRDNNNGKGYGTPIYQTDHQTPVAGYELTRAAIAARHYSAIQLDRNEPEALKLLQEQFPAFKTNTNLLTTYAYTANRNKSEAALMQLKGLVQETLANAKATEEQLETALLLSEALETDDLYTAVTEKMKKRFAKGKIRWYEQSKGFFDGGMSPEEQQAVIDALLPLPKTKAMQSNFTSMAYRVASTALRQGNTDAFDKYAKLISNRLMRASLYNSYAWKEAGEGLEQPAGNLEMAQKLSKECLQLVEAVMQSPTEEEVYTGYSPAEMKEILQRNYAMFADTYGLILYRNGDSAGALQYQQIACEGQQFSDPEANERYCLFLEKAKGAAEVLTVAEKLIAEGKASAAVKAQYKRLFASQVSPEQAADKYIALLEKEARQKTKEELQKKMIDEEAPMFTLRNLNGETVSLESLKGKVVVLDFWATWCGPCISSFPGMQRAQEAHANRSDVVFLFVDTWENGADKEKNASDFLAKNKYPFTVLMDNDNAVVGKYKVQGIPTKFILDKNGRIRFKSVGYSGNPDTLVDEMAFMIELAGQ